MVGQSHMILIILGGKKGYVDLGAEKFVAAVRHGQQIAVEGKSFAGASDLSEFQKALGQFNLYSLALQDDDPERILYLAVPSDFYREFMEDIFFQKVIKVYRLNVIILDTKNEKIVRWITQPNIKQ